MSYRFNRYHPKQGRAPYAVRAAGGGQTPPRRKGEEHYGDRVMTLCGTCGSRMQWSAYDELFFCSACGYNLELLKPRKEQQQAPPAASKINLPENLEIKYTTTDNKTMDDFLSVGRDSSRQQKAFTKPLYKDSSSRKTKTPNNNSRRPMSDFDRAMSIEDRLNEKMGRNVTRLDIRRRQSFDIL